MLNQWTREDKRNPRSQAETLPVGAADSGVGLEGELARVPAAAEAPPSIQGTDFLTSRELGAWLHISRRTVANWQRRQVVPYLKVGRVVRFRRDQVEAALAELTLAPAGARVNRNATAKGGTP